MEYVLKIGDIARLHEALSSFLHAPSLKDVLAGKDRKNEDVITKCEATIAVMERVLSSTVFGDTTSRFVSTDCMRCNETIYRRIPETSEPFEARCLQPGCTAEYLVCPESGTFEWAPMLKPPLILPPLT